jgi:hypothetical protein
VRFLLTFALAVATISIVWVCFPTKTTTTKTVDVSVTQTIYIRNLSPRYMSDKEIQNDMPAWERSYNHDFAPVWHTTQFHLVFLGRKQAPAGGMVATFVKSGPVQGALAYHDVSKGVPGIVVYSGTGVYYGYDNSVSFTHELEELGADPTISVTNQGWPYDWINVVNRDRVMQTEGTVWAQEVSDPVEAYSYLRPGADGSPVHISDFVEPNWFNNAVNGSYDFMNLVQQPFTILPGGYAQFLTDTGWTSIQNFRKGHPADAGFYRGEGSER